MTEETRAMAERVLGSRGFVDALTENSWNSFQQERDFANSLGLTVWTRRGDELNICLYGQGDNAIHLLSTNDESALVAVLDKVIDLCELVESLSRGSA